MANNFDNFVIFDYLQLLKRKCISEGRQVLLLFCPHEKSCVFFTTPWSFLEGRRRPSHTFVPFLSLVIQNVAHFIVVSHDKNRGNKGNQREQKIIESTRGSAEGPGVMSQYRKKVKEQKIPLSQWPPRKYLSGNINQKVESLVSDSNFHASEYLRLILYSVSIFCTHNYVLYT